jgi:hypothetical protein
MRVRKRTAPATATDIQTAVTGAGTAIVSPMEGVEAASETIGEEMEAVPDRAKVLTQMKIVIGPAAATRATATVEDVEEAVEMVAATTTAAVAVRALVHPAVIATATTSTASATGPETPWWWPWRW